MRPQIGIFPMLEAVVRYETCWLEDPMAVIDRSNAETFRSYYPNPGV